MNPMTMIEVTKIENGYLVDHDKLRDLSGPQRQEIAADADLTVNDIPAQDVEYTQTFCATVADVGELISGLASSFEAVFAIHETAGRLTRRRRARRVRTTLRD